MLMLLIFSSMKTKADLRINSAVDLLYKHVSKTSYPKKYDPIPTELMYTIPYVQNISWDYSHIQSLVNLIIMWRFS